MQHADTLWFMFHNEQLLLQTSGPESLTIPRAATLPLPSRTMQHRIGTYHGLPCIACEVESVPESARYQAVGLRASYDLIGKELYQIAGRGAELQYWDTQSRYCPFCGESTLLASPTSKRCPQCGKEIFPGISTAILALVRKEDMILLVRAHNFKGPNYGLVAGFLEPGETLEECVQREVMEETRLTIRNIRYFGSQPWPYPSGLMVGFSADYVSGDIRLQEDELSAAEFFRRDTLPLLPHELSLARQMIDWWRQS